MSEIENELAAYHSAFNVMSIEFSTISPGEILGKVKHKKIYFECPKCGSQVQWNECLTCDWRAE